VFWYEHTKKKSDGKPPTLRIEYKCHPAEEPHHLINEKTIKEWVCIEHEGFANRKARQWWSDRSIAEFPSSVEEATQLLDRGVARCPARIETVMDGKWPRVQNPQFIEEIPLECDWLPEENREYAWVDDAFDDVPF
jgi:DNA repair protein RadD